MRFKYYKIISDSFNSDYILIKKIKCALMNLYILHLVVNNRYVINAIVVKMLHDILAKDVQFKLIWLSARFVTGSFVPYAMKLFTQINSKVMSEHLFTILMMKSPSKCNKYIYLMNIALRHNKL